MKTYANYPKQPERRMVRRLAEFADRIGWGAIEEAPIPGWSGRADLILEPRQHADTWLIEAKHTIATNQDLRDAITQAIGYRPFVADIWGPVTKTIVLVEHINPTIDTTTMGNPHGVVVLTPPRLRHTLKESERRIRVGDPAIDHRHERRDHQETMRRRGKLAAAYYGDGDLTADMLTEEFGYLAGLTAKLRAHA